MANIRVTAVAFEIIVTGIAVENIHPATAVETVGLAAAGEVFSGATGLVSTEDVAGFVGEAAARSEVDQEVAAEILEVGIRRFAVGARRAVEVFGGEFVLPGEEGGAVGEVFLGHFTGVGGRIVEIKLAGGVEGAEIHAEDGEGVEFFEGVADGEGVGIGAFGETRQVVAGFGKERINSIAIRVHVREGAQAIELDVVVFSRIGRVSGITDLGFVGLIQENFTQLIEDVFQ